MQELELDNADDSIGVSWFYQGAETNLFVTLPHICQLWWLESSRPRGVVVQGS